MTTYERDQAAWEAYRKRYYPEGSRSRDKSLPLEQRTAAAIEQCLVFARANGVLGEDDAMEIAKEWTTSNIHTTSDDPDAPEDDQDLDAIEGAVETRFGF